MADKKNKTIATFEAVIELSKQSTVDFNNTLNTFKAESVKLADYFNKAFISAPPGKKIFDVSKTGLEAFTAQMYKADKNGVIPMEESLKELQGLAKATGSSFLDSFDKIGHTFALIESKNVHLNDLLSGPQSQKAMKTIADSLLHNQDLFNYMVTGGAEAFSKGMSLLTKVGVTADQFVHRYGKDIRANADAINKSLGQFAHADLKDFEHQLKNVSGTLSTVMKLSLIEGHLVNAGLKDQEKNARKLNLILAMIGHSFSTSGSSANRLWSLIGKGAKMAFAPFIELFAIAKLLDDIFRPVAEVMEATFAPVISVFQQGLTKAMLQLTPILSQLTPIAIRLVQALVPPFAKFVKVLLQISLAIIPIFTTFLVIVSKILDVVMSVIGWFFKFKLVSETFTYILATIVSIVVAMKAWAVYSAIVEGIQSKFIPIIKSVALATWEWVSAQAVLDFLTSEIFLGFLIIGAAIAAVSLAIWGIVVLIKDIVGFLDIGVKGFEKLGFWGKVLYVTLFTVLLPFIAIWETIKLIYDVIKWIVVGVAKLGEVLWNGTIGVLAKGINLVKGWFGDLGSAIKNTFKGAFSWIYDIVGSLFGIFSKITGFIERIFSSIKIPHWLTSIFGWFTGGDSTKKVSVAPAPKEPDTGLHYQTSSKHIFDAITNIPDRDKENLKHHVARPIVGAISDMKNTLKTAIERSKTDVSQIIPPSIFNLHTFNSGGLA